MATISRRPSEPVCRADQRQQSRTTRITRHAVGAQLGVSQSNAPRVKREASDAEATKRSLPCRADWHGGSHRIAMRLKIAFADPDRIAGQHIARATAEIDAMFLGFVGAAHDGVAPVGPVRIAAGRSDRLFDREID
ncbi:MAG: hypothetical protein JWL66_1615 [Sphingomonadales bacterium]|nr:hypothetical protein [Sphingomonadales bacterium]